MSADGSTIYQGVGVGRGMAVGPVVKVHPSPAVPHDAPGDPAGIEPAFDAVSATLVQRAEGATRTVADILRAT